MAGPLSDEACLYALRLLEKGYSRAELAAHANCTVAEIEDALRRADELRKQP